MRLAGGRDYGDTTSVDAFMAQAATYETGGDTWDKILKVFNTAFREHPFHTVRAAELERWRTSGEYDAIIAGSANGRYCAINIDRKRSPDGVGQNVADRVKHFDMLADDSMLLGKAKQQICARIAA